MLHLLTTVSALLNTSPLVVVSEQHPFNVPKEHRSTNLDTMQQAFEDVVSPAVRSCAYDSYIFVKHPQVAEKDINSEQMPFLRHAIDRAASRFLMAAAFNGQSEVLDTYVDGIERGIERNCGAKQVKVNIQNDVPFETYTDTQPRILSVELPEGVSTSEADKIIKRVVGYLPNGNFIMAYRTTPSGDDYDPFTKAEEDTAPTNNHKSVLENYSFFTPGIFMGLMACGLLFTIFVIGLTAVVGLDITPAAFEKKPKKD